MGRRRSVRFLIDVPGLRLEYGGPRGLFDDLLTDAVIPLARSVTPAATLRAVPESGLSAAPVGASAGVEAPPFPVERTVYAELGRRGTRSAERDAVLCALVELSGEPFRDVHVGEVLSHLAACGYPGRPRVKPILGKLRVRHGLAVSGTAPGTWRPTPAAAERVLDLRAVCR